MAASRPRVISVVGLKKAGKTSVVEAIVRGLKARGHSAGAVKSMVHSTLSLDVEGKDTFRHRAAGADFVMALSGGESALIWDTPGRMTLEDVLRLLPREVEYLVCEGLEDDGMGDDVQVVMALWDAGGEKETREVRGTSGRLVAYSGRVGRELSELNGLPVFNVLDDQGAGALVDLLVGGGSGGEARE